MLGGFCKHPLPIVVGLEEIRIGMVFPIQRTKLHKHAPGRENALSAGEKIAEDPEILTSLCCQLIVFEDLS